MAPKSNQLHFVLIPLMAQGHMIPMVDISKLLAQQGVTVTLITTSGNAARFEKSINRVNSESGFDIRVVKFPFPYQETGIPQGCESLDTLPSRNLLRNFFSGVDKLQEPLEHYLETANPWPSCLISDKALSWTLSTAKKFKIARIVFHGMCCFSLLCSHNIHLHKPHLSVNSNTEPFTIPGIPQRIEVTKVQLPGSFVKLPDLDEIRDKMQEAESESFGVIVNSFHELEHDYDEKFGNAIQKKVWCVGPVSLCNQKDSDKFERGNDSNFGISEKNWLEFLDGKQPRSVIYVCMGSLCRLIPEQLIELGLGLEKSNRPFIWVIKTTPEYHKTLNKWLIEEKFEDRVNGRGIVIKNWAPQVMILSHRAIGGFLTHCGWNSTIEAICSGVPMITWPLFAEQFFNEKLVVEVLRIGIRVGVEVPVRWGEEERVGVLVKKDSVLEAIEDLMNDADGNEGGRRRLRAQEFAAMARKAMATGGSSHSDMLRLIQDVKSQINSD